MELQARAEDGLLQTIGSRPDTSSTPNESRSAHLVFPDGSQYYGELQGTEMHGRGICLWSNGAQRSHGAPATAPAAARCAPAPCPQPGQATRRRRR
jgi:hypothetical protein